MVCRALAGCRIAFALLFAIAILAGNATPSAASAGWQAAGHGGVSSWQIVEKIAVAAEERDENGPTSPDALPAGAPPSFADPSRDAIRIVWPRDSVSPVLSHAVPWRYGRDPPRQHIV